MLVLESEAHHEEGFSDWVQFVEKDYGLHDETNWWIPGVEALRGMMRTVGFELTRDIELPLPGRAMVFGQKQSRLNRGKLSLLHESRNIKVLWSGNDITAGHHIYSAYKSQSGFKEFERTPDAWADSTDRRLFNSVDIPAQDKMIIEKDYYFWDMIETWEFELKSEKEIEFKVIVNLDHSLELSEIQISFMLAEGYAKEEEGSEGIESFIKKIPGTAEIIKQLQRCTGDGNPVISFKPLSESLPKVTFECVDGILSSAPMLIMKSGTEQKGLLLRFARKIEGMDEGRHLILQGRLHLEG